MANCLDALLRRISFKSKSLTKLNNFLELAIIRITEVRNRCHSQCMQSQVDIAQLLLLGQTDIAFLRAERVIKDRDMIEALVMVQGYCHLIIERAFLLPEQRECPEELREAVAGLVYAATRCRQLECLMEIRHIFVSRFGKEFTSAAIELRNNCGVSGRMVQKFSTKQPSLERRAKVVIEIAREHGIKVDITDPTPQITKFSSQPSGALYILLLLQSHNHEIFIYLEGPASSCLSDLHPMSMEMESTDKEKLRLVMGKHSCKLRSLKKAAQ